MIRCHFSRLLGERKLRVSQVSRDTGLNHSTLNRLYREDIDRIEMDVIEVVCTYFGIGVGELLELVPNPPGAPGPRTKFRTTRSARATAEDPETQ
jgi:putative transcriptional regulator